MQFEGKYFDGKTSTGFPATVVLTPTVVQVSYFNGTFVQTIEWLPEKIHSNDFAENQKTVLKYGDFPFQYLEVNDLNFAKTLKENFPNAKFHKTIFNFVFSTGFGGLIALAIAFLAIIALAYFVVLPAAVERIAVTVPVAWEKQLGDAAYSRMVSEDDIDEANSRLMNDFFKKLNYKSNYDIEISVVKENVVNAYALPGGKIVVYEGIIRKMDNYEELAALLSHEFSHVELKHSTRNIFRSLSSYLLLSVLFGDASGITAVVIQNADQLKQLGYSRTLENEADRNGLKLMKQRRIDPQGMEGLFTALKTEEGKLGDIPQFLSTHPLTDERLKMVKEEIAKHNYTVAEDEELNSLFKEIKSGLE